MSETLPEHCSQSNEQTLQTPENEEHSNNVNDNNEESVIDLELHDSRDDDEKEVVDLTKDFSGFVDLTKDDFSAQASLQYKDKHQRKKKQRKQPYSRTEPVLDDSIEILEILPNASSNSQPVRSESKTPGKKIICPICMDDSDLINRGKRHLVSTTCGHIFCNKCLEDSLRLKRNCPSCRRSVKMNQYHKLFI